MHDQGHRASATCDEPIYLQSFAGTIIYCLVTEAIWCPMSLSSATLAANQTPGNVNLLPTPYHSVSMPPSKIYKLNKLTD